MKFIIGLGIGTIGAYLWQNGGWTGDERYEDLKITGKLGCHMFCTGLRLMGISIDELENMVSQLRIIKDKRLRSNKASFFLFRLVHCELVFCVREVYMLFYETERLIQIKTNCKKGKEL